MDVSVWMMEREIKCVLLKDVMVCDSNLCIQIDNRTCLHFSLCTYTMRNNYTKNVYVSILYSATDNSNGFIAELSKLEQ